MASGKNGIPDKKKLEQLVILAEPGRLIEEEAAAVRARLAEHHVRLRLYIGEAEGRLRTQWLASLLEEAENAQADGANDNRLSATLFLSDSPNECSRLYEAGAYPAALLTVEGRKKNFSGVLYAVEEIGEISYDSYEKIYERLAGEPWVILETARCLIREMCVEDVDGFYRIYEEPAITEYMEGLYEDKAEEIRYTEEYIRQVYGFYGYGLWTVTDKSTGEIIGRAGLSHRPGFEDVELGFLIAAPRQRQGYAEEVCRAILRYAGEELGFPRVQALVREGNTASLRLCRKLGFQGNEKVADKGREYVRLIKIL